VKVIILAGGLGTRLSGITGDIPKPMARVGAQWEIIREHFGDSYRGISLKYSVEDEPLGTGGAIRQALEIIPDDEIIVLNGDTLFHVDLEALADAHHRGKVVLTIALKQVADCGRFGRVNISDNGVVTEFLEKSTNDSGWINGGIYMLNRRLLDDFPMPVKFSFEKDLLEPNIGRIRPVAFQSNAYFIDMGVPEDYERAQSEIGGVQC
jgi:D-glycero-alpha-D-manno-heptose 1-phosphate guanylyltransferase